MMHVTEVKEKKHRKEFIRFPKELYKNDPCWVCPLDSYIKSVFDPLKNPAFGHGEAIRWILTDENGRIRYAVQAGFQYKSVFKRRPLVKAWGKI
jgi:hypothetical protein